MKEKIDKNKIIIYQAKNGALEFKTDVQKETIWLTQAQIAQVFDVDRSVVTRHIKNIFSDRELNRRAVCAKFAHTAEDGKMYQVQFYNLDIVLAVGYRTNSKRAIDFRKWATSILRAYVVDGFIINRSQISKNYDAFLKVVQDVKTLLPKDMVVDTESILELITVFADTWLSLDAYDKDKLISKGKTKKRVALTAQKLSTGLLDLKSLLIEKKQATDLFGRERTKGSIAGIVGNVMQSFDGKDLYPTVEEKAAHLLFFIVKNHPFVDGNKRSGAYSFVWFLRIAGILDVKRMTPPALTAITLLIAESNPKQKDKMIGLVLQLLKKQ